MHCGKGVSRRGRSVFADHDSRGALPDTGKMLVKTPVPVVQSSQATPRRSREIHQTGPRAVPSKFPARPCVRRSWNRTRRGRRASRTSDRSVDVDAKRVGVHRPRYDVDVVVARVARSGEDAFLAAVCEGQGHTPKAGYETALSVSRGASLLARVRVPGFATHRSPPKTESLHLLKRSP
jgi:hypothetical protein